MVEVAFSQWFENLDYGRPSSIIEWTKANAVYNAFRTLKSYKGKWGSSRARGRDYTFNLWEEHADAVIHLGA